MSWAGRGKSLSCAGCIFVLLAFYTFALAESPTVSYRQQIRPILAANCFKCHGPDPTSREADLRLDEREAATADRGGYAAIAPGDADASEVWKRIVADDPDVVMPPPSSNKTLSAEQKELLGLWIREGAKYEAHWAFQPPEKPPIPQVNNPAWIEWHEVKR